MGDSPRILVYFRYLGLKPHRRITLIDEDIVKGPIQTFYYLRTKTKLKLFRVQIYNLSLASLSEFELMRSNFFSF